MATPDPAPPFTTSLSAAEVERSRKWHEWGCPEAAVASARSRTLDYLGPCPVVPPGVMEIAGLPTAWARRRSARCGPESGFWTWAPAAASTGGWPLGPPMAFRFGDVLAQVPERFDLIIFDPPFRWLRPRDLLEAASTGENYAATTRFFRGSGPISRPRGGPSSS